MGYPVKFAGVLQICQPISAKVLFGLLTRVGPRNDVLDGGPDPTCEGTILRWKV